MKFSSRDQDNDQVSYFNCVIREGGGWWHRFCNYIQLNDKQDQLIIHLNHQWLVTSFTEMKIRPKDCNTD